MTNNYVTNSTFGVNLLLSALPRSRYLSFVVSLGSKLVCSRLYFEQNICEIDAKKLLVYQKKSVYYKEFLGYTCPLHGILRNTWNLFHVSHTGRQRCSIRKLYGGPMTKRRSYFY